MKRVLWSLVVIEFVVMAICLYKAKAYSPEIWFPNDLEYVTDVDPVLYAKLIEGARDSIPRISRYYVKAVSISKDTICVHFQRLEHLQDVFIRDFYNRFSTASDYVVAFSISDTSFVGRNQCSLHFGDSRQNR